MNTKMILTIVVVAVLGLTAGCLVPRQLNAADKNALYYACPMHPAIHYNHPGNCPICGMKLEPVYAGQTNAPAASGCCAGVKP
jgi:Cu(I)/Ag(I) efflux system membrane fusion protein